MIKSVSVIGGGIAGLSAAVFLSNQGFKVNLYEASPKLGGRTYSFFDKQFGGYIDNGQHIMAAWYNNTFDYLRIIGSIGKLYFQQQMEVNFINQRGEKFFLKASKLPPPLHLLNGLLGFKALKLNDRVAAIRLISSLKSGKIPENRLKKSNTSMLFNETNQTKSIIENFWKPFIIAVFNSLPESTSAYMFGEIIKTGFLKKDSSNLVLPDVFLSELLVEPAVEYLENNNCRVITNKRISKFNINNNRVTSIICEDKSEIESDFYVCSVPFFEINNLLNGSTKIIFNEGLSPSPIVNIHLKFEEDISSIISKRFYGILESTIQWVFRVKNNQVCIVISSAKNISEMEKEQIISICLNELFRCFPDLEKIKISGQRVIKEMRATFIPDKDSLDQRPDCKTKIDNFYLAGDWVNTGLPSTIESAVKSARICVNEICKTAA